MKTKLTQLLWLFTAAASLGAPPAVKTPPGYRIEEIAPPEGVEFQSTGLDFAADGVLFVATREGDVWTRKPMAGPDQWRLFARGLQDPLGVLVDKKPGHVFVCQRSELTELIDENGDGVADVYRRVNGDWGFSGNYHEFAHGPVRDSRGNFYVALNLAHGPGGVQGSIMARPTHHRGWVVQITPDGKFVPYASGFRSPLGITITGKDELFVMDSQGDWLATSPLEYVVKDRFYLHPSSLADRADFAGKDLNTVPKEEFEKIRTPPVLWVPYGELANSPGQPVFNLTKGKFGPFENQIFFGDQTKSNVMRAVIEEVDGEYQGAVFNFANGLKSGYIRGTFAADGSFWMAEIDHGWSTAGGKPAALERLVWDGKTMPFEMQNIQVTSKGFKVSFTKPVEPGVGGNASSYLIKHWHYFYHGKYGSDKVGETAETPSGVAVSIDGRSVDVNLPLVAGEVYQITAEGVRSNDGESLVDTVGWYTLNRLPKK